MDTGLGFQQTGQLGEATVDDSVWVVKTHAPDHQHAERKFRADKVICITRHPFDVFPSAMSLMCTVSHTVEPRRPWNEYNYWPTIVDFLTADFVEYHRQIVERSKITPTFFLTYEQLILDPEPVIYRLFCFMLGVATLEGSLVEQRIR